MKATNKNKGSNAATAKGSNNNDAKVVSAMSILAAHIMSCSVDDALALLQQVTGNVTSAFGANVISSQPTGQTRLVIVALATAQRAYHLATGQALKFCFVSAGAVTRQLATQTISGGGQQLLNGLRSGTKHGVTGRIEPGSDTPKGYALPAAMVERFASDDEAFNTYIAKGVKPGSEYVPPKTGSQNDGVTRGLGGN